MDKDSWNY